MPALIPRVHSSARVNPSCSTNVSGAMLIYSCWASGPECARCCSQKENMSQKCHFHFWGNILFPSVTDNRDFFCFVFSLLPACERISTMGPEDAHRFSATLWCFMVVSERTSNSSSLAFMAGCRTENLNIAYAQGVTTLCLWSFIFYLQQGNNIADPVFFLNSFSEDSGMLLIVTEGRMTKEGRTLPDCLPPGPPLHD